MKSFKNERVESIAKVMDKIFLFLYFPQQMNTKIFPESWKITPIIPISVIIVIVSACNQSQPPDQPTKAPVQVELKANITSEVPAIEILDNKLFVSGKEMLAKDFVDKYCFAKRDNQTCIEAIVLNRIQARNAGGFKPTKWGAIK